VLRVPRFIVVATAALAVAGCTNPDTGHVDWPKTLGLAAGVGAGVLAVTMLPQRRPLPSSYGGYGYRPQPYSCGVGSSRGLGW
jgi:hypothetical protein